MRPTSAEISKLLAIKRRLLKERGNLCEVCLWDCSIYKSAAFSRITLLQPHHVIPRGKGGTDDDDNLVLLCPNDHALAHGMWGHGRRKGPSKWDGSSSAST